MNKNLQSSAEMAMGWVHPWVGLGSNIKM